MQLSRSISLLAVCITFAVAPTVQYCTRFNSRYFQSLLIATLALFSLNVIDISAGGLSRGVRVQEDPVAAYFRETETYPRGGIWTENVSKASYLSRSSLRFVTGYNGHREPHPYSSRLNGLMKNDLAFTGITNKQVSLLNSYSRVLGVEYIFLPKLSPLVHSLTDQNNSENIFQVAEKQISLKEEYLALHNQTPIHYAYVFPGEAELLKRAPAFPTLSSQSWEGWDQGIIWLANQLQSEQPAPLELNFLTPDRLTITVPAALQEGNGILILQSYDRSWKANVAGAEILPTAQRFMFVKLPTGWSGTLELKHTWPKWQIPVQLASFLVAIVAIVTESIYLLFMQPASRTLSH